jgi:hypothetical protein
MFIIRIKSQEPRIKSQEPRTKTKDAEPKQSHFGNSNLTGKLIDVRTGTPFSFRGSQGGINFISRMASSLHPYILFCAMQHPLLDIHF